MFNLHSHGRSAIFIDTCETESRISENQYLKWFKFVLTLSDISLFKYKSFIQIEKSSIKQVLSFCQLSEQKKSVTPSFQFYLRAIST
jgi:hypothetical protein